MSKGYRRSRTDYPKGVIGIYDNAGQSNESADRYMVVFEPLKYPDDYPIFPGRPRFPILTMSGAPYHPQGVCMSGETPFRPTGGWQSGAASAGKTISFSELPADCQRAVKQNLLPVCAECGCDYADGGHYDDCPVITPFLVLHDNGEERGRFETAELAAAFIDSTADPELYHIVAATPSESPATADTTSK